ncbi:CopG family transcriptional regulator [Natrinema sp. CBA1119]|uniref:ribbon-helix-helix domain-containing protein n=1 Tax=Natrinema sp. CBA1119 TaxID=1608465 RepID=UPI000BF3E029|nr:ribbon-helix-helix domain-containing protein [Natrinema sp. CBA1119]PGF17506.1 CopG family transcriptional regulator [Natrinema sp. CBA1119]
MSRSPSSDDVVADPDHSRLADGRTLERVTFRATGEQLAALESLVDADVYHSRSEALRAGVQQLLERHRSSETDRDDQ